MYVWFDGMLSSSVCVIARVIQISENEVCGCPLMVNVFESSGEFCRVAKRSCNRHHAWEKLRRAEVDMERLRQVSVLSRCTVYYQNNCN